MQIYVSGLEALAMSISCQNNVVSLLACSFNIVVQVEVTVDGKLADQITTKLSCQFDIGSGAPFDPQQNG